MPERRPADEQQRIAEILRRFGVPDETISAALEHGDIEAAVLESALLPGKAERTVTPAEVEARGGLSAGEIAETFRAMGLFAPEPTEPALTQEEAQAFVDLGAVSDIWSSELRQQAARVYGRLLSRIARTGVQLFRHHAEPRVRAAGGSPDEQLAGLRQAFETLLSVPDPLLVGVHRRWLEYEVTQTRVRAVEEEAGALPGAVDVTFLFCDLKDFTAYANSEGDEAAVEAIDTFVQVVESERGDEGRIVKALGDGTMLAYDGPPAAVGAGARIISAMQERGALGVHASVHSGVAIARDGDYFGGSVNLAARLLNAAGRDELVGTEAVVASSGDSFSWERLGERRIRGVDAPVEVFRLRPAA